MNWFKLSEFNISGQAIPEDVADKIYLYHIIPGNRVRDKLGLPMWPSENSGYRPRWWELHRGRSSDSQHVFKAKGAVDWNCKDFHQNHWLLLKFLIEETEYTRFAIYPTFIHCDYAIQGERWVFNDKWERLYSV